MTSTAKPAINCDQVYALVVGIETYDLGADYNLDGPAQDGLKFIDWLLSHGVEPGHIRFFVSPLAKNSDVRSQAEKRGINTSPATRDATDSYLRNELISERMRGEGLYVFWGGHGILTKTHSATRRLLFADTTATNKLNLDVDSLVQALGTSAYGAGFERQIFLIDACANAYFQGLYETIQGEAAGQRYSAMSEQRKVEEQFVLFAAEEYEVAKNGFSEGIFSAAVLAKLQEQVLWPKTTALAEWAQLSFESQTKSSPAYLWIKAGPQETIMGELNDLVPAGATSIDVTSKKERLKKEIDLLMEKLDRCFEKRLLTDDPDRQVTLEKLEAKLERDIQGKKLFLEKLS